MISSRVASGLSAVAPGRRPRLARRHKRDLSAAGLLLVAAGLPNSKARDMRRPLLVTDQAGAATLVLKVQIVIVKRLLEGCVLRLNFLSVRRNSARRWCSS